MREILHAKAGEGEEVGVEALGLRMRVVVPEAATAGDLCLIREETRPGGGPPLHVHHRQTELFVVQEGLYDFAAGDRRLRACPGDVVVVPPGVPHAFHNPGPGPAAFLFLLTPALGGERFFREMAELMRRGGGAGGPPDMADLNAFAEPFGLEFVGPPLADETAGA